MDMNELRILHEASLDTKKGTLLIIMFHKDKVILGFDTRICSSGPDYEIAQAWHNKFTEAKVFIKAVVDPCFIGLSGGKTLARTKVFFPLQKELSEFRDDQHVCMSILSPKIERRYNDLIKNNKEAVHPSCLIVTTLDDKRENLEICLFGTKKASTQCYKETISRDEKFRCVGMGQKEAMEVLNEGYNEDKSPSDMVDLMYDAMNAVHARNKQMGGEFHAYVVSIDKFGSTARVKTERLKAKASEAKTILGIKRKREIQRNTDEIPHLNLSKELRLR